MVETIAPVVYGNRRRYIGAVTIHTIAAGAAAACTGFFLGAAGMVLGAPWPRAGVLVVAGAALAYALRDGFRLPLPVPHRRAQVPDWWRTFYSPPVAAALYGAGLGAGFFTYLTYGTFAVVAVAAVATGNPVTGALLCVPFGLVRGLSVLVAAGARDHDDSADRTARLGDIARTRLPGAANAAAAGTVVAAALAL